MLRQPGSVAAADPFKEDVKVQVNEVSLTKWLMRVVNVSGIEQEAAGGVDSLQTPALVAPATAAQPMALESDRNIAGFDALELDYSVPFPLSLVISRKTVLRYQLLFRHLLSLRHLETLLVGSWLEHGNVSSWRHKGADPALEMWKRRAWTLRARMLVFVQQLLYFSTAEVMQPNWQRLMEKLEGGAGRRQGRRRRGRRRRRRRRLALEAGDAHRRRADAGPRRLSRHVSEGVHADELEAATGASPSSPLAGLSPC